MGLSYRIITKYGSPKRKMVKMNDDSDSEEYIDEDDIEPFPSYNDVYMKGKKFSYELIDKMKKYLDDGKYNKFVVLSRVFQEVKDDFMFRYDNHVVEIYYSR